MNFENIEAFVIPFSITEKTAWKEVSRYISEQETTPVEAVYKSKLVSITKEYYPVERLELDYTADWEATSIFMRYWTEQETHYEQRVHYFDRWGDEHENSGFDYYDTSSHKWKRGSFHFIKSNIKGLTGDPHTRPWDPREVTVAVTEEISCEEETGRKKNSGTLESNHVYHHDRDYPLSAFLTKYDPEKKIPYSKESVKDGGIIEQSKPFAESDYNSALSNAKSLAKKDCIGLIPGQKYAGFQMEFNLTDSVCQILHYPVYHVRYEFMGQPYECFVSGYCENAVSGTPFPEDEPIENVRRRYREREYDLDSQKGKLRLKYLWIYLGVCAGLLVTGLLSFVSIIEAIISLLTLGAGVYLTRKNINDIKNIKTEIKKTKEISENYVSIRQAKKKELLDILLNDNLSDSEKAARYEIVLRELSASL